MSSRPAHDGSVPSLETDRELGRAAGRGDPAAAAAVVGRLLPRVRNLVRYLVRGDRDVEDLAQSALLEVLDSLGSYRGEAPLERWADRVVVRSTKARLARRSQREREQRESAPMLQAIRRSEEPIHGFAARRDLARALDGLPDAQREALVLHHALGMSIPEVADAMEVSFDTAKSRLRLGMEKLRALLVDDEGRGA